MSRLHLARPLAFIDLETTGTDTENDRIVEIAICKLFPDMSRETRSRRINPWMPIPKEATAVHGITNSDVADCPSFGELALSIWYFLDHCDIAGFNSNKFDLPMLYAEFLRAGITWDYRACHMVDVGNIFKIREPRTLSAAVKFYCGKDHEGAHAAEADVEATADVLLGQLDAYQDLPAEVSELALESNYGRPVLDLSGKFTLNDQGVVVFAFGKYPNQPAVQHRDYLEWMLYKANFAPDTRQIAQYVLDQIKGGKPC